MIRKIREKINLFIAKSPEKAVLISIMLFNIVFVLLAAGMIALLSTRLSGLKECSFWEAVYHTILMMLDAGCVESVIADIGKAGALAGVICIVVVVLGMMFFTGAVIGYITNSISKFIENKNNGMNRLLISDHTVIINWNSRAAEIINECLYRRKEAKIVVFVPSGREEIDKEIRNRLDTTLLKETKQVYAQAEGMPFFQKRRYLRENLLKDKITYIVREGDVAAATDLDDICISKARTVIILDSSDTNRSAEDRERGNTQTVKTLIQVSEISKANSRQTILVEVADRWTEELVDRIIEFKEKDGKETVIPVSFNRLLGKTHSHIAIMPELYDVYDNLFSNKGAHFLSRSVDWEYSRSNENDYIRKCLAENCRSIPLTVMETIRGHRAYFMADFREDLAAGGEQMPVTGGVKLKTESTFRKKCIVVFGHNSNMDALMEGFDLFRKEMNRKDGEDVISIVMADDVESLRCHNFYREYPYVRTVAADIYDEGNKKALDALAEESEETTILVLSDDQANREDVDAKVLTYLIYIQEQIRKRELEDPGFRRDRLDVIVEILNAKNEDMVRSYGADRVLISNRYLSRVLSQASRGETVIEFYADILSYTLDDVQNNGKEILIRAAEDFFEELPGKCTAYELIRQVFESGAENRKSMILGYIRNRNEYVFFDGDQRKTEVELRPEDRLIIFGNHGV